MVVRLIVLVFIERREGLTLSHTAHELVGDALPHDTGGQDWNAARACVVQQQARAAGQKVGILDRDVLIEHQSRRVIEVDRERPLPAIVAQPGYGRI